MLIKKKHKYNCTSVT